MKILSVTQQTDNKTLSGKPLVNMFDVEYENNGRTGHWYVPSRNAAEALECVKHKETADTVSVVPFIIDKDGDEAIILINESRVPTGGTVWAFCSGLVDPGETELQSALRELKEEIGAEKEDITEIHAITDRTYKSEGMTDESAVIYEAYVSKLGKQELQDNEDIKVRIVKIKDIPEFIKGKIFSTMAGELLPSIYKEYMLKKELETQKKEIESLRGIISGHELISEAHEETIEELKAMVLELTKKLEDKDKEIDKLTTELAAKQSQPL